MVSEIRECKKCRKRYVLEKGFYKSGNGHYHLKCKKCTNEIKLDNEYKKRDNTFDKHWWEDEWEILSKCKRCGIERKKIAHMNRIGVWLMRYRVNDIWVKERPEACIKIKG